MSDEIKITEAEWEVMESVWAQKGQTAGEVLARVEAGSRSHRTLRTLLTRLVDKGVVAVQIQGTKHLYSAAVSRETCVKLAARTFSERFFAGDLKSLLLHFVEQESLSDAEVAELRRKLEARTDSIPRPNPTKTKRRGRA